MISGQRLEVGHLLLRFTLVSAARKECLQVSRLIVQIAHGFPCRARRPRSAQQQPLTRFPPLYKLYLPSFLSLLMLIYPGALSVGERNFHKIFLARPPLCSSSRRALMSHYSALPR